MSKGAELHEAVQELHLYLSDRIAPLMFAYSMDLLLEQPAALSPRRSGRGPASRLASMPGVPFADLLFHAVQEGVGHRRVRSRLGREPPRPRQGAGRGRPRRSARPRTARSCARTSRTWPSPSDRGRGPRRDPAPASQRRSRRRGGAPAAAVPKGLTDKVASGLRKLGLFLDRLQVKGVAVAARRAARGSGVAVHDHRRRAVEEPGRSWTGTWRPCGSSGSTPPWTRW